MLDGPCTSTCPGAILALVGARHGVSDLESQRGGANGRMRRMHGDAPHRSGWGCSGVARACLCSRMPMHVHPCMYSPRTFLCACHTRGQWHPHSAELAFACLVFVRWGGFFLLILARRSLFRATSSTPPPRFTASRSVFFRSRSSIEWCPPPLAPTSSLWMGMGPLCSRRDGPSLTTRHWSLHSPSCRG